MNTLEQPGKAAPVENNPFEDIATWCMFIGYPRSGHSLIGALLNAHKNAVIAHELNALQYVKRGCSRDRLLDMVLQRDRDFTGSGSSWYEFDYKVPNQWQGRFERLTVIGDKKGGATGKLLGKHPELLEKLRKLVDLPLRIIHIVRNPFDNISTMTRRSGGSLKECMLWYFRLCKTANNVIAELDASECYTMRYEDFLAQPKAHLQKLCDFIGLQHDEDYLDDCANIVFSSPTRSRTRIEWPEKRMRQIRKSIAQYDFLRGYTFEN